MSNTEQALELFKRSTSKASKDALKDVIDNEISRLNNSLYIATEVQEIFRLQGRVKQLHALLKSLEL